jgi:hypothetical protein
VEHVHDHVDEVEQRPPALLRALDVVAGAPAFFISSSTCCAIARTCVSDVPVAMRK